MNQKFWIGLSSIESLDSIFIKTLYEHFGDIEKAFYVSKDEISQIEGLNIKKANIFLEKRASLDLDKIYQEVEKRDIKVLTFDDENYPKMLREISNPPMVLYYKGDLSVCNFDKTVAVVGSRHASFNGKESLKKIINGLSGTDICIVSGLATGIDTLAHQLALSNGLKTIGVIASGFDFVYPTSNKKLYEEIINGNGVIFTEYYPTFEPLKFRFPQRNRIVSGLSYGTLVVEAALKSGALITANLTLEQGRELMCIPGLITNPNTEGIYKLLKTGATLITESDDVLNALGWEIKQCTLDFNVCDDLTIDEKKILYTINIEPKCFDEIQRETDINTNDLLVILTGLELKGKLEQIVGDRYSIIR